MKIINIVGARPQLIKAAAVWRALEGRRDIEGLLVHTGQHYDRNLNEVHFEDLTLPSSDYHLGIGSATHGAQTGRMLEAIERVLIQEGADWVLVYGDTNSTLAGALAAAKLHIPLAHVEAGLRSFNRRMPEEVNRVLTDHASDLLLAPSETAVANLHREGVAAERIHEVGDVMYDSVLHFARAAEERSSVLERLGLQSGEYILATLHRAENTDRPEPLRAILDGLARIAEEVPVVLPLHPRTRKALEGSRAGSSLGSGIRFIEPVGYLDMLSLEKGARLIVTDSGGVQKEAYFQGVPCVTLRAETEWVELLATGWAVLLPPREAAQVEEGLRRMLTAPPGGERPPQLYGDGKAAERILTVLERWR